MTTPKWTEERTAQLVDSVGDETPVSRATVAELADELQTSTRSISSKFRVCIWRSLDGLEKELMYFR